MRDTNPQIEKQLSKLAELCCQQLNGDPSAATDDDQRAFDALLKALLMSGYARKEGASLQFDIESRVKDECRDPAMHRGGALSSITSELQTRFNKLARWESRQPDERQDPKAANISSATDA